MTTVWHDGAAWLEQRNSLSERTIGLVPTMGALHRGHAALVERCRAENEVVVVTIFVNPSQFNDPADLERYPRTLKEDLALLENLGADHVLVPSVADMYPNGYGIHVEPADRLRIMEGAFRPGFLPGMMTVVLKLLGLVRAHRAYFGNKDYQQLQTIRQMAREFFIPTKIVGCATVREQSGLAESSRNRLLSAQARHQAAGLHRALTTAADTAAARAMLEAEGFIVEYIEEHWNRRLAAVFLEGVRLIDNVPLPGTEGF